MNKIDMNVNKPKDTGMSRREFVGALGIGLGGACLLGTLGTTEVLADNSMAQQRVIMYDSTKCIGCHTCEQACKIENNLPGEVVIEPVTTTTGTVTTDMATTGTTTETTETTTSTTTTSTTPAITVGGGLTADTWLQVTSSEITLDDGSIASLYIRHACMHCGSCAKVCPAHAIVQREDGIVTVDPDKCIGCHYCFEACPFDIPRYGDDGAMQKCIMCYGRVDEGKEPACVEACPTHALTFGYREDIAPNGTEQIMALKEKGYTYAYLYGDNELGGLPLMYTLPYSFDLYDLPELPMEPQNPVKFGDLLTPIGLMAAIAAVSFGGIKYLKSRGDKQDKNVESQDV